MPAFPLPDPELRDDAIRLRPPADRDIPDITMACQDSLSQVWALRELGFARVDADIDVENEASHRVVERAGFQREGVRRSLIEAKGRRWTVVSYSLLPEDLA